MSTARQYRQCIAPHDTLTAGRQRGWWNSWNESTVNATYVQTGDPAGRRNFIRGM